MNRMSLLNSKHALMTALLIISEAVSALSLYFLGLIRIARPWDFFLLLIHGFYLEVGLSVGLVVFPFIALMFYLKGGFLRWLSYWLAGILGLTACSFILGLYLLEWMFEDSFELQHLTYFLTMDMPFFQHFIYTQLAALFIVYLIPGFVLFEKVRPANKVLGDAHFANGLEIQRAGFLKKKKKVLS
jgi:type IV secretion system protein VirD4